MARKAGEDALIVNVHEKGEKRGVSIYFGSREIELLKKKGFDLRKVQKFFIEVRNNKLQFVPISSLYEEPMDIDALFEITSRLDALLSLERGAQEELAEAFLSIIVESGVKLSEAEKAAFLRLMRGAWVSDVLKKVLNACARADTRATLLAINRALTNSVP